MKLSTCSSDGKTLIVRIADSGEVLGLPAVLTGKSYELTADVIEPTQANFISRADFLAFLREHGEASLRVAQQLGETYHAAIAEMRSIGLPDPAEKSLHDLCSTGVKVMRAAISKVGPKLTLTHEEIAQVIGTSRETVTRLFADFKKKRILYIKGSLLVIRNKLALENLTQVPE